MKLRIRWLTGAISALCITGLASAKAGQVPAAQEAECAFAGKRIVNSLARDDVDTAEKFVRFYERFSCPAGHLRAAFRCTVEGGAVAPGKALSERVDECWARPAGTSKGR